MTDQLNHREIYLTKSLKVIVLDDNGGCAPETVATLAKNFQALGFGLSQPLFEKLTATSKEAVLIWYEQVLPCLKTMVGAHRQFKPMYPNFPKQVMEASEAELYFNAMTHYYGFYLSDMLGDPNLVILPNYEKKARPILEEFHELRWIDLGTLDDFNSIFTRLVASNGSLSESDKEILLWFMKNRDVDSLFPEEIPQKETLAFLVANTPNPERLIPSVKTATDVLRVAVAMSEGDVSLFEATKYRNFTKRERRFLLGCLEQCGSSLTEDMLRWKPRWIRLGERLHPGDFKKRFPKALAAFDILRNNKPFKTFNSKAEAAIKIGSSTATASILSQRPGDFTRRLDQILRTHVDQSTILESFNSIADNVSTPVLLQAWSHFQNRRGINGRAFFPKGNAAKVQFKEGPLPELGTDISDEAAKIIRNVLVQRFSQLPALGQVFIDERLIDQFVPFSQRSASRSLRAITRGSSFDLPQGETVRFFCWWKNIENNDEEQGRVDLDLSASLFMDNWELIGDISYYNLREGQSYHSGDITSAPSGACEFIDISLPSVKKMGARYVVMSVLSFTGQSFVSLPECFGGWMMRQKPNSGEIFDAKTVHDKIDITASSRSCVPVIIDILKRKVYWADLGLKSMNQINNAANNSVGFSQIGKSIVELNKTTLYELFEMHAEARGEQIESSDNADTIFGLHEGTVTAFDTDEIMSNFLG
ncbi:MAG: cytoplasmic protein [Blastopirellula sp.]|nr:MAG: cytoplasmic protein [Blastopirellula sp.]